MLDAYVLKSADGECVMVPITFEGAGGASPTNKVAGAGVTLSWVSTGIYRATFSDYQGRLLACASPGLWDTAPAGVAGFTAHVDQDSYTASTKALDVHVYNASQALADLPATSYMSLTPVFSRKGA